MFPSKPVLLAQNLYLASLKRDDARFSSIQYVLRFQFCKRERMCARVVSSKWAVALFCVLVQNPSHGQKQLWVTVMDPLIGTCTWVVYNPYSKVIKFLPPSKQPPEKGAEALGARSKGNTKAKQTVFWLLYCEFPFLQAPNRFGSSARAWAWCWSCPETSKLSRRRRITPLADRGDWRS